MLQQTLIYYTTGSTAVLQGNEAELLFSNVSLSVSGSEYETDVPGGFGSTVGTIRIELYSGSILVASFPYDQTNLIINSSSAVFATSSTDATLVYQTQLLNVDPSPSYFFKVIESSSLNEIVNLDIPTGTNGSSVSIISSSKYTIELFSGNNKYNQVYLYDITGSLLLTSSWIVGSGSFTIEPTSSYLSTVSAIVSGAVCCSPTLTSVTGLGYERLSFSYTVGSCGTFDSMSVFQSTDQVNWALLASGSSPIITISDSGSYPVSTSYYRLIQHCNDGIDMYNSDPSNVLSFTPEVIPNVPNYYYVSIVGRTKYSTPQNYLFYYSPNSGSTQISLGSLTYDEPYQPITSFFVYSGSVLVINPASCNNYGIGYNGSFSGYCSGNTSASISNYKTIISSSTTIYVNVNDSPPCC